MFPENSILRNVFVQVKWEIANENTWEMALVFQLFCWSFALLFLSSSPLEDAFTYECTQNQWVFGLCFHDSGDGAVFYIMRKDLSQHRLFALGFGSSSFSNPCVCRPLLCLTRRIITLVDIYENVCGLVFSESKESSVSLSWLFCHRTLIFLLVSSFLQL